MGVCQQAALAHLLHGTALVMGTGGVMFDWLFFVLLVVVVVVALKVVSVVCV